MRSKARIGWSLVILLGASLWLAACGDSPPTATSLAPTPTAQPVPPTPPSTTQPTSEATSTPVVLPTPRFTVPPNPSIPGPGSQSNPGPTAAPPVATPTPAYLISPVPSPTPRTFGALTGYPGKLSILGSDLYVYVSRFDGKPPQLLLGNPSVTVGLNQDGEIFRFPTWSRDGTKLAAMGINIKGGQTESVDVFVAAADGSGAYKVQDSEQVSPVYISWSPDGNFLTLLMSAAGASGLELRLADTSTGAAGAKAAGLRKVIQGSPLYTSWSNDSDSLVIHTMTGSTDTLSLYKAKDNKATPQAVKFSGAPGAFRSPAWSSNGSYLAFSTFQDASNKNDETIVVQGKDGTPLGTLFNSGLGAAFNWSPTGAKLAYAFRDLNREGLYLGLNIADPEGPDAPRNGKISSSKVISDDIIAFFWSPDGKKLAYLTFNDDESRVVWNIYEVDNNKSSKLIEWYPSSSLIQVINYFDQYAQSDSIWSPDSKALVFSGWINSTIQPDGKADGPSVVYVMPTEGPKAGQPQPVSQGVLSFWAK